MEMKTDPRGGMGRGGRRLSIGTCICKLSITVLHTTDRFICRVVTVSVLFS